MMKVHVGAFLCLLASSCLSASPSYSQCYPIYDICLQNCETTYSQTNRCKGLTDSARDACFANSGQMENECRETCQSRYCAHGEREREPYYREETAPAYPGR
jgi:hypothetical protein